MLDIIHDCPSLWLNSASDLDNGLVNYGGHVEGVIRDVGQVGRLRAEDGVYTQKFERFCQIHPIVLHFEPGEQDRTFRRR